jgi:hypothetical protein
MNGSTKRTGTETASSTDGKSVYPTKFPGKKEEAFFHM